MKGMKSRLLSFQNLFHSSDLNKDDAETMITAPRVADGMYTNISEIAATAIIITIAVTQADNFYGFRILPSKTN